MGHLPGVLKTFIDRFYTFSDKKRNIKHLNKKKFITITCSGAPNNHYKEVTDYLNGLCSKYFSSKPLASISAGNLAKQNDILKQTKIIKRAEELASKLK